MHQLFLIFCEINFDNREEGYGEDGVIGDDKNGWIPGHRFGVHPAGNSTWAPQSSHYTAGAKVFFYSIYFKMFLLLNLF